MHTPVLPVLVPGCPKDCSGRTSPLESLLRLSDDLGGPFRREDHTNRRGVQRQRTRTHLTVPGPCPSRTTGSAYIEVRRPKRIPANHPSGHPLGRPLGRPQGPLRHTRRWHAEGLKNPSACHPVFESNELSAPVHRQMDQSAACSVRWFPRMRRSMGGRNAFFEWPVLPRAIRFGTESSVRPRCCTRMTKTLQPARVARRSPWHLHLPRSAQAAQPESVRRPGFIVRRGDLHPPRTASASPSPPGCRSEARAPDASEAPSHRRPT